MRWFRRFPARRPSTLRTKQSFRPHFECLEARETPAGNVVAAFAGGTLTIKADNFLQNKVGVNPLTDNNNDIVFIGNGPGNLTLSSSNTMIDGGSAKKSFTNVNNIVLNMGLGNDNVTIFSVSVTGSLAFNGGDGDDVLNIGFNVADNSNFGSLTVKNGDGNDSLMTAGKLTVTGAANIDNGVGNSNTTFGIYNNDTVTLGSLKITNGDGLDSFTTTGSSTFTVLGACTINNGSGGSTTTMGNFSGTNPTLYIGGALSITSGQGTDSVTLGNGSDTFDFRGSVSINTGTGISDVKINMKAGTIKGPLSVTTLDGASHKFSAVGTDFKVQGAVNIKNGPGNSVTEFKATSSNALNAGITVTNGVGNDTFTFGTGNALSVITGNTTITNGAGESWFDTFGDANFLGSLTANFGDGLGSGDHFGVQGTNFATNGPVTVNFGIGAVRLFLDADTTDIGGLLKITCAPLSQENVDIGTGVNDTTRFKGLTYIGGGVLTDLEFNGNVTSNGPISITTGDGADSIEFDDAFTSNGPVTINTGEGNDSVTVDAVTAPVQIQTATGVLTIKTGGGADTVKLKRMSVTGTGTSTIDTGSLNDVVWIDNSNFAGAVTVNAGTGDDTVDLERHTNDNVSTTFQKAMTINLGVGDDSMNVGFDTSDNVIFAGTTMFNGGGLTDDGKNPFGINQLDLFRTTRNNQFLLSGQPKIVNFAVVQDD